MEFIFVKITNFKRESGGDILRESISEIKLSFGEVDDMLARNSGDTVEVRVFVDCKGFDEVMSFSNKIDARLKSEFGVFLRIEVGYSSGEANRIAS